MGQSGVEGRVGDEFAIGDVFVEEEGGEGYEGEYCNECD